MEWNQIELVQTCGACPEQYDAYLDGKLIGYLRLRHGYFNVRYPDAGGESVYDAHPKGDGIFEYEERQIYLNNAKKALYDKIMSADENNLKKLNSEEHCEGCTLTKINCKC